MIAEPALQPTETLPERLITGEELFAMGDIGKVELENGRIVHLMPTGRPHSRIEMLIALYLGMWNLKTKFGEVHGGETGIFTGRNPDTVRGMDAALISHDRLQNAEEGGYLTVAPELVVEVMSPGDSWQLVNTKLMEYFAIGVLLVWIVDPKTETIHVYRSITKHEVFDTSHTLTCEDVLPGFSVEVSEIFG